MFIILLPELRQNRFHILMRLFNFFNILRSRENNFSTLKYQRHHFSLFRLLNFFLLFIHFFFHYYLFLNLFFLIFISETRIIIDQTRKMILKLRTLRMLLTIIQLFKLNFIPYITTCDHIPYGHVPFFYIDAQGCS